LDVKLKGGEQGKSLTTILEQIEKSHPVRFYFLPTWFEGIVFDQDYKGQSLRIALDNLFLGSDLNYLEMDTHAIVFVKDPSMAIQRINSINTAVKERKKIEKITLGSPESSKRGSKILLQGKVRDAKNNEPLTGASVFVNNLKVGVTTDVNGDFSISIPSGEHVLTASYINYEERVIDLSAYKNGEISLVLEEVPRLLDEIVVMDRTVREVTTSRIGQTQLSIAEIKRKPAMFGEVDLIKQIQVQPGVTTAGEAASGFNVRGGGVDQNLVLYDGMPVFNTAHAFGFFSTFNTEAIRDVNFYRGGIPAEFGGRVSSVLDISSREGNYERWSGSGGIGIISTNFFVSGPIQKDKTSVAASIRTTYSDWLLNTIRTNYIDLTNSSVSFYDGALKLSHRFSERTKLTLSGYASNDWFRLQGDTSYQWKNLVGSVRLDHSFSPRLSSRFTVGTGSYAYQVSDRNSRTGFNLYYKINYPTAKADFNYQSGKHHVSFGVQSSYYNFNPGTLEPTSNQSNVTPVQMEIQKSIESAFYAADGISFGEKYYLEGGLRYSLFTLMGPATVNTYEPGVPKSTSTQIGEVTYGSGEKVQSYSGLEPRLSLRFNINSNSSIKAGYNRIYQYLHLVSNTTAITPVDVWQPSNNYFKPQVADQVSVGFFKNFKEKMYEAFVEVYYKTINNILDFKDGASLILNDHIEADLLQGTGEAYGIETSLAKLSGRLTGSINYTYSRSFRTINGEFEEEKINQGNPYPSNFDQPHIFNINWKYNISRRYFFTGSWTFHTGRPISAPLSGYVVDNIIIANFSERNQYRVADYHRLDIALILEGSHKRKKFWDGTWALSLYNVYARRNPYTVFFEDNGRGYLKPYQLSIIGTVVPSISYSFKF
jgi:hypothetical protein